MKYTNLYNFVDLVVENVKFIQVNSAVSNLNSLSGDYYRSLFFLTSNCLGISLNKLINSVNELGACERNRVEKLKFDNNMFLYVGIGVLGVNFAFLALYLLSIDSNLNSV